jgi:hypothetical protein
MIQKKQHINQFQIELEKEIQEIMKIKNKKKNTTSMKQFGGLRLLGYVDKKPLIAQYKINSNGFSLKFNQQILDKEYAGNFNKKFLDSNLEIYSNGRLSAPIGKLPTINKGGRTTIETIAWIATLCEIENLKSELAYVNKKISKNFFHYAAHAIFTSDILEVEDSKNATSFLDAIEIFNLEDNEPKNNMLMDTMLKKMLYPQFVKSIKSKDYVLFTNENRLFNLAA